MYDNHAKILTYDLERGYSIMEKIIVTLSSEEQTSIYGGEIKNIKWNNEEEKKAETYYYIWTNN